MEGIQYEVADLQVLNSEVPMHSSQIEGIIGKLKRNV